jgi:hypothetical protein
MLKQMMLELYNKNTETQTDATAIFTSAMKEVKKED